MHTITVDIDQQIIFDPKNARKTIDGIGDLADAIHAQGLLNVPIVRVTEQKTAKGLPVYMLLAGERRVRACRLLVKRGLTRYQQLEVRVWDESAGSAANAELAALTDNIARVDLHPLDSSLQIAEMLKSPRWTVARIAKASGKSRGWISSHATIGKKLHPELHKLVRQTQISWRVLYEAAQLVTSDYEPDLEKQRRRIFGGGASKFNGGNKRMALTMGEIRRRGKYLRNSKKFPVTVRRHIPQILAYLLGEEEEKE